MCVNVLVERLELWKDIRQVHSADPWNNSPARYSQLATPLFMQMAFGDAQRRVAIRCRYYSRRCYLAALRGLHRTIVIEPSYGCRVRLHGQATCAHGSCNAGAAPPVTPQRWPSRTGASPGHNPPNCPQQNRGHLRRAHWRMSEPSHSRESRSQWHVASCRGRRCRATRARVSQPMRYGCNWTLLGQMFYTQRE